MKPTQLRKLLLAATIPLMFLNFHYISIAVSESNVYSHLNRLIDSRFKIPAWARERVIEHRN
jgi:hypothetical protein